MLLEFGFAAAEVLIRKRSYPDEKEFKDTHKYHWEETSWIQGEDGYPPGAQDISSA